MCHIPVAAVMQYVHWEEKTNKPQYMSIKAHVYMNLHIHSHE